MFSRDNHQEFYVSAFFFFIMHIDKKTGKDPLYIDLYSQSLTLYIDLYSIVSLVDSDQYQLGVHNISRVGFVDYGDLDGSCRS
uniref:Uncharacterized protein n=1 Tax=Lactuca sativa TaxID=4236 RepID=A0A9R1VFS3_LACSA|nr:hypothetical protein LSAT_V11C500248480 [Lactuca sativa]